MTNEDLEMLQNISSMSECLRWALHATSAAQLQSTARFDKVDPLQEAYKILWDVYVEAKEDELL